MKSHESGLWITEQRLTLHLWWTHDHEAVGPLQDSGGRRNSSERGREREEFVGVLTNDASWR
jgi:hypothetical protein